MRRQIFITSGSDVSLDILVTEDVEDYISGEDVVLKRVVQFFTNK
ncbi:MAG TPA: hypothetical protein VF298_00735 [Bacteroidales bacterium]|jgi:hypothetical protein